MTTDYSRKVWFAQVHEASVEMCELSPMLRESTEVNVIIVHHLVVKIE